jgi:hypothetical protein
MDDAVLRGPVEVLTDVGEGGENTGLCVYDLTQMVYEDGRPISPNAHENTGPVSRQRYERALNHVVP